MKKDEKGITLVILVLTIVIMLILSGTIITYTDMFNTTQNYSKMVSDIEILEDKILIFYNLYGELPTTGETISNLSNLPSSGNYKEVDLNKLSNITLNYGNKNGENDYYVIDINSHNVYYVEGITLDNDVYYSN